MDPKADPQPPAGTGAVAGKGAALADDVLLGEVVVSPELRARILRQIDQVMAEGRRPATAVELAVRPCKKGVLYPVLVNVVAATAVVLGSLVLARAYHGEQAAASLASAGFQSAEGRLLDVARRESESRLQEQEAQTREARERLAVSEGSLQRRLREREADLRRSMDEDLAAERKRLNAQGLALAEVERRLRALEAERQAALAAEVGQLRAGLRLQEMADARDEERLAGDRISATLARTLQKLQDDDLAGARASLAALKSLLSEPVMRENPGLRKRLPVDLMVAEALSELLAARARPQSVAEAAADERAALRAELERSRADLAERERQVQGLQRDLRSRAASTEAESASLSSQLAAAAARAESSAEAARAAVQRAVRQGQEEAFKDVIAFLDYMQADPARKQQLNAQLAARARQDPLYAAVAREIQILAAGAGLGGTSSPFRLLGTVSSLSSGRVVVEPLVDLGVKAGARVQIRRASGLASEVLVARGIVQQAGAAGITVLLDAAGKTSPVVMDVVYVEAGN